MSRGISEEERATAMRAWLKGLKVYKSPRACPKCGKTQRRIPSRQCVNCSRVRARSSSSFTPLYSYPRTRQDAIEAGELYYFPNRRCARGHISKRLVRTNGCFECQYPRRK